MIFALRTSLARNLGDMGNSKVNNELLEASKKRDPFYSPAYNTQNSSTLTLE